MQEQFSLQAIRKAIFENFVQFRIALAQQPGGEIHRSENFTWINSGLPCPTWNGVLHAALSSEEAEEKIQRMIDYFGNRGLPFSWWITPLTRPSELGVQLEKHGLVHVDDSPGMALLLSRWQEEIELPPSLTIQVVQNSAQLGKFIRLVQNGFHLPDACAQAYFQLLQKWQASTPSPFSHYLGIWDGRPVGSASLFFAAEAAGIYSLATLPEFRGKGIGTALTVTTLREAKKRGFQLAVLRASPLGVGIYRRIGFQEYFRLGHYLWQPGDLFQGR